MTPDKREELIEELKAQQQRDVDAIVYYRNLAIQLGAKPDDMRGTADRRLCETWDAEGAAFVDGMRTEEAETWRELEKARAEVERLKGELERAESGREGWASKALDLATLLDSVRATLSIRSEGWCRQTVEAIDAALSLSCGKPERGTE